VSPQIAYEDWKPQGETLRLVAHAQEICEEYATAGYDLTLRQLYYQFVARDIIRNNQKEYNRLGTIINKARLSGLLDWDYIVDRTRNLMALPHWTKPSSIIDSAARGYRLDKWSTQLCRVEVWVEKEALAGVVSRVADRNDCAWFSCRGYVSQSEMWGAAQRFSRYLASGQNVIILHLGDHDPSGIDMTRDIEERLNNFVTIDKVNDGYERWSSLEETDDSQDFDAFKDWMRGKDLGRVEIRRIALNRDQIDEYNPPPNPAKMTDSRFQSYADEHGEESWELDALPPDVLDALIEEHIRDLMDEEKFRDVEDDEEEQRRILTAVSERWEDVAEYLNGGTP
jgi:hypothetical protein